MKHRTPPRRPALTLALALVLACGLAGCISAPEATDQAVDNPTPVEQEAVSGSGSGSESEPAPESEPEPVTYALGDTVTTDIASLTLDSAEFAFAYQESWKFGGDNGTPFDQDFYKAKEYDPNDSGIEGAPKGSCFVVAQFEATNLDRAADSFGYSYEDDFVSVTYQDQTYNSADPRVETSYGLRYFPADDSFELFSDSFHKYLDGGETEIDRLAMELPFEPESLTDPFELTFYLPNSDGSFEPFTFKVG